MKITRIIPLLIILSVLLFVPIQYARAGTASFVIGSNEYITDGVAQFMDVAPYVRNGRTYIPVRYVVQALGVSHKNILWDDATQTVTLMKDDKVVQLSIGSNTLVVNGKKSIMDVPAEITKGRTMLPFRYVAQAFGATVNWDDMLNTLTIKTDDNPITSPLIDNNRANTLFYPDGSKYVGELKDGLPEGKGTYTWANGTYEGDFKGGYKHGFGVILWPDGAKYVGMFQHDKQNGKGEFTWPDGDKYVGDFRDNIIDGNGTYIWRDGAKYTGQFKNGQKHGQGTLVLPTGEKYTGEFAYNKITGNGVYSSATKKAIVTPGQTNSNNKNIEPKVQVWTLILIADDDKKTYLGRLTTNKFDSESIYNDFGTYGSKFSSNSIWNEFGSFGGKFSSYSPFNEFTSTPPLIVDGNGNIFGRLTVNKFVTGAISPYIIYNVLKELSL